MSDTSTAPMTQKEYNRQLRTSPAGWFHPAYSTSSKMHYHVDNNRSLCGAAGTFASDARDFSNVLPDEKHRCKSCYKKIHLRSGLL